MHAAHLGLTFLLLLRRALVAKFSFAPAARIGPGKIIMFFCARGAHREPNFILGGVRREQNHLLRLRRAWAKEFSFAPAVRIWGAIRFSFAPAARIGSEIVSYVCGAHRGQNLFLRLRRASGAKFYFASAARIGNHFFFLAPAVHNGSEIFFLRRASGTFSFFCICGVHREQNHLLRLRRARQLFPSRLRCASGADNMDTVVVI